MRELEVLRRHIAFKRDGERSLKLDLAQHMPASLDGGAAPDYQALMRSVSWPTPPRFVFHTAARDAREHRVRRVAVLADGPVAQTAYARSESARLGYLDTSVILSGIDDWWGLRDDPNAMVSVISDCEVGQATQLAAGAPQV